MTNELSELGAEIGQALADAPGAIGNALSALPDPVQRGLWKVAKELTIAGMTYAHASLQSVIDEKKAISAANVKLIQTQTDNIARQMAVDPEYVLAANEKYASKIVRKQITKDKIFRIGLYDVKERVSNGEKGSSEEIGEDFINTFDDISENITSEEMQILFGKILSGEILKPGSFSIKTLRLVAQIDHQVASIFRIVCSLSSTMTIPFNSKLIDARVISLGQNAATNTLTNFGLSFERLNLLHEYGLIISDFNSWMNYGQALVVQNQIMMPFNFQGRNISYCIKTVIKLIGPYFRFTGSHYLGAVWSYSLLFLA